MTSIPPKTLFRVGLAAFVLMWLAAIAQEPGGMRAFASELEAVEQRITEAPAQIEQMLPAESDSRVIEYWGGVVCSRAASADHSKQQCADVEDNSLADQ